MVSNDVAGASEPSGRRRSPVLIAAVAAASLAAPAASAAPLGQEPAPTRPPASEEAIVLVRAPADPDGAGVGATRGRLRDAAAGAGLDLERAVPEIGVGSIDLPAGESVGELRDELRSEPGVVAVEPNLRLEPRLVPSDPAYGAADRNAPGGDAYQWNLRKSGFERAWDRSRGAKAKVAVIDTGADAAHPDLRPAIEASFDEDDSLLHGGAEQDENGHGSHVSGQACGRATGTGSPARATAASCSSTSPT
jgi:subtilisin family serine protease